MADLKYNRDLFSPELFRALKDDIEAQSRVEGEIAGLTADFDVFTGSQDPGDRYVVGKVTRKGKSFWVEVYGINVGGAKGKARNPTWCRRLCFNTGDGSS